MSVVVSGIVPAFTGRDSFLIDTSGSFSLDRSVVAYIWLVGGGCDGGDGFVDKRGIFHGGKGGDGGAVYKFGRIKLLKNTLYTVKIAEVNDPLGTSFEFGQILFSAAQLGCSRKFGGTGGIVNINGGIVNPAFGNDGIPTPYGVVGSSGGGGVCAVRTDGVLKSTSISVGGQSAGNSRVHIKNGLSWDALKQFNPDIDAQNYGCGGGGNTFCYGESDIGTRSRGKGGCVIVQYVVLENDAEDAPDCSIQYWDNEKADNGESEAALREKVNTLYENVTAAKQRNEELKKRLDELEKRVSE